MEWKKLNQLSAEDIKTMQSGLLKKFVRYQLPYSPFYRKLFQENHLSFDDIETLDDLQRLPFTSKRDIAPTNDDQGKQRNFILQPDESLIKKHASALTLAKIMKRKMFGQDVARELEREYKPVHIHFTTGRTALPTAFSYSERDIVQLKETGARMLDVIGIPRTIFGVNAFPYAPHLAFWLTFYAMQAIGLSSVQTGGGKIMGTKKIMDLIERVKAGLVTFIPGYCHFLLRKALEEHRDFSSLRYVIFGGERVAPGLRDKVRDLLAKLGSKNPTIFSTYAFTEGKTAWIQCAENTGYHVYPDMEYFEVVDKEGNRVKDGEPGELVYSSLNWRGTIVMRYKTGDLVQGIAYEPCPHCGKTVPRIHPDIQRSSEIKEFHLTKIKGELVNLNAFYPLLSGHPKIDEWIVEIRKKDNDPYGVDELIVHIAPHSGADFQQLIPEIQDLIQDEAGVNATVTETPVADLLHKMGMETELKEKRIIDNRPIV